MRREYPYIVLLVHISSAFLPWLSSCPDRRALTVYGSIATPVNPDKKPPNLPPDHTHQWTVSVKGVNDADISYFIKKVQFKLHDTYANPLRSLSPLPSPDELQSNSHMTP